MAISEQKPDRYNMILEHPKIEVDKQDLSGKTALHYASEQLPTPPNVPVQQTEAMI